MKDIKVRYHVDELKRIKAIPDGNWVDLRAAKTVYLDKGDFAIIPLGVSMKLPKGYEALVVPRSSTFKNYGLIQTNGIGIIDESYCGDNDEWGFPVYATRSTVVNLNDRICQFRIIEHQPKCRYVQVFKLSNRDRGGFGSTGIV